MEELNSKQHWENIYKTKSLQEVSWYQPTPSTSLELIAATGIKKTDSIIDIGGGDSFLVDHLLELGYSNITVLDISAAAIDRAKTRLGVQAAKVHWEICDVLNFKPMVKYQLWHDRAAFHFLTSKEQVRQYVQLTQEAVEENGSIVVGTFSEEGPMKCSGIEIKQYSEHTLAHTFTGFQKISCQTVDHSTPFNTIQNFTFCTFKKTQ